MSSFGTYANTTPISPDDIKDPSTTIPGFVYNAFNQLIMQNFNHQTQEARIKQSEVIEYLMRQYNICKDEIFAKHYLDVEKAYEAQGWGVDYDKPAYNETYSPVFIFKKKQA